MRLHSGLYIRQANELILGYARYVCPAYDAVNVPHDDELRPDEIWLSRQIGSRLFYSQRDAILGRMDRIRAQLTTIPADVDLADVPLDAATPGAVNAPMPGTGLEDGEPCRLTGMLWNNCERSTPP